MKEPFSWENEKVHAEQVIIRRFRTKARTGNNPSFNVKYPNFTKEYAENESYTSADIEARKIIQKRQEEEIHRREIQAQ